MNLRALRIVEFLLLCVAVPGFIIIGRHGPYMFAFLYAATFYAVAVLYLFHKDEFRQLWGWSAVNWRNLKPILIRWVFACIGMTVFLYYYEPKFMFDLVERKPEFILFLILAYPIISALPQELVFCNFFFTRYAPLFGNGRWLVLASAITFAYAHVLYINPVAPLLSLFGGLIFARTYMQHRSLALVTLEHGLYGNALFLIGLGPYFYSGGVPAN